MDEDLKAVLGLVFACLFIALVIWAIGCASSKVTFVDERGKPVVVEQSMGGRGCIAMSTNASGGVDVTVQQDGSSDWSGVRALPAMVKMALTTFFGDRDPMGNAGFDGPSDIRGCAGLFEVEEDGPET